MRPAFHRCSNTEHSRVLTRTASHRCAVPRSPDLARSDIGDAYFSHSPSSSKCKNVRRDLHALEPFSHSSTNPTLFPPRAFRCHRLFSPEKAKRCLPVTDTSLRVAYGEESFGAKSWITLITTQAAIESLHGEKGRRAQPLRPKHRRRPDQMSGGWEHSRRQGERHGRVWIDKYAKGESLLRARLRDVYLAV